MPEGDTVHKLATALNGALRQRPLSHLELRPRQRLFAGEEPSVLEVSAKGKHCLIDLSNGYSLRVHLGMHGSWLRYRGTLKHHRDRQLALGIGDEWFVCCQPREVELLKSSEKKRHPPLLALGPDLLGPEPDWEEVWSRTLQLAPGDRQLGEVLLDQKIAAGLGNVYKSELCYLGPLEQSSPWQRSRGTSPFSRRDALTKEELLGLWQRGRELLLLNLGGWPRTTAFDPRAFAPDAPRRRVFVYGRNGKPCIHCGAAIVVEMQGLESRSAYWCPRCQPLNDWR